MKWHDVSQDEYQETFGRLRRIVSMIENDPRLDYKVFKLKQKVREVTSDYPHREGALWRNMGARCNKARSSKTLV